mgnify:CR=1 FL=1
MWLYFLIGAIIGIYAAVAAIIFLYGRKGVRIHKDYNYRPSVTAFIPTYNEEIHIARKLDELLRQTYPIDEILVIDCSTDSTPEIVKQYSQRYPNIILVRQSSRVGMARTLNQAIDTAKGEIFIKTDADTYLHSDDAIREVVACFADPAIGAVTCSRVNRNIDMEDAYVKFLTLIQIAESNIDSIVIGNSPSLLAFRRSIMEHVDPYSMAEDTEEVVRIRRKGYRAIIEPTVVTEEEIPTDMKLRRLQKDRRAEGIVRVLLKNRDMLFNPRYGKYGLLVLPIEFFILVISPFLSLVFTGLLLYTAALYHPLLSVLMLTGIVLPMATKRTLLSAIIDVNISGLIATLKTLRKPEPLWKKVR